MSWVKFLDLLKQFIWKYFAKSRSKVLELLPRCVHVINRETSLFYIHTYSHTHTHWRGRRLAFPSIILCTFIPPILETLLGRILIVIFHTLHIFFTRSLKRIALLLNAGQVQTGFNQFAIHLISEMYRTPQSIYIFTQDHRVDWIPFRFRS